MNAPTPGTRFEAVVWGAFVVFYASAGCVVVCALTWADFRFWAASLLASMLSGWGAFHARALHQDNKLAPARGLPTGSSDDWELGEA